MLIDVLKKRLIIQCVQPHDILYGTEDHIIWKSLDSGKNWKKICVLQPATSSVAGRIKDKILRNGVLRRYRRNIGINNLVVLHSGVMIAQYDKIYRCPAHKKIASPVFDLQKEGISSPLKNGLCYNYDTGHLYFGEYIIHRPASIKIVRGRDDGRTWEICYQFPRGGIRHVHGIYYDQYRARLWICTGDNNSESGLYYTDDDFKTVQLYGGGDQSWRMVSLLITEDNLIWGTDAGQDAPGNIKNYIYKLNVKSGQREKLCCIDKPAYYSTFLRDGSMCIATTFEPKIARRITPSADLWWSKTGNDWDILYSFPYKFAGRNYGTKYATIVMPSNGFSSDKLICSLLNVEKFDFTTVKIDYRSI